MWLGGVVSWGNRSVGWLLFHFPISPTAAAPAPAPATNQQFVKRPQLLL